MRRPRRSPRTDDQCETGRGDSQTTAALLLWSFGQRDTSSPPADISTSPSASTALVFVAAHVSLQCSCGAGPLEIAMTPTPSSLNKGMAFPASLEHNQRPDVTTIVSLRTDLSDVTSSLLSPVFFFSLYDRRGSCSLLTPLFSLPRRPCEAKWLFRLKLYWWCWVCTLSPSCDSRVSLGGWARSRTRVIRWTRRWWQLPRRR
jgi:hypothetical protein